MPIGNHGSVVRTKGSVPTKLTLRRGRLTWEIQQGTKNARSKGRKREQGSRIHLQPWRQAHQYRARRCVFDINIAWDENLKLLLLPACTDIIDGNLKLTLGMIWTLVLRFTIADITCVVTISFDE